MPRNSIPAISPRLVGSDLGIDLLGVIPAISAVFACSRLPSSDAPSNQRASTKTAAAPVCVFESDNRKRTEHSAGWLERRKARKQCRHHRHRFPRLSASDPGASPLQKFMQRHILVAVGLENRLGEI
jgi:hypothetical protein